MIPTTIPTGIPIGMPTGVEGIERTLASRRVRGSNRGINVMAAPVRMLKPASLKLTLAV